MKALITCLLALSSSVLAHEHIDTKALQDSLGQGHQSTIFGQHHRQIPPKSLASPSPTTGSRFNENHINRAIAEWSLRQVNSSLKLIDDAWVTEEVYAMTAQMNAQVRTHALLSVPIIADDGINAFAVPGGLIGMNTGTILASESMDEVASVLAHEIAHLSQRHYEHRQDEKGKLMALQLGGLLTAILARHVTEIWQRQHSSARRLQLPRRWQPTAESMKKRRTASVCKSCRKQAMMLGAWRCFLTNFTNKWLFCSPKMHLSQVLCSRTP